MRAVHLDPKLKPTVKQEIKKLGENVRAKHVSENKNYWASSKVKWEQKAQAKKSNKNELKLADKRKPTKMSYDQGQEMRKGISSIGENSLSQACNKKVQQKNTNTLNKENTSSLPLKEGSVEPVDKEECSATANVGKENTGSTTRLYTINQIKESHSMSPEKAVKSTGATQNTDDLKRTNPQMELMNPSV